MEGVAATAGGGWSDAVEDLVDRGDVDGAISLLESLISSLDSSSRPSDDLRLPVALGDLAHLHASRGLSLKADELRSRAVSIRARSQIRPPPSNPRDSEASVEKASNGDETEARVSSVEEEDDWEAVADRVASGEVLLSSQKEEEVPVLSPLNKDLPSEAPRRRGRGSFLYKRSCLYSDQPDVETTSGDNGVDEDEAEDGQRKDSEGSGVINSKFGTGHVLVVYDFPPSTRTIDLERLFGNFRDRGFSIQWVIDTVALAVFRTPLIAHEAQRSVKFPFKVRPLREDDILWTQISGKDLEPPLPRPETSARTAQRMIAQGMGMRPTTNFGSNELRKQEEARKNRILARQTLKDEAWGSDQP